MANGTLRDPVRVKRFLAFLRGGNYWQTACRLVGVHRTTAYALYNAGAKPDASDEDRAFFEQCEEAMAVAEATAVECLRAAAMKGNAIAALRFLERRYPDRWGRKDRHEISGPDGGPIAVAHDTTRINALLDRLAGIDGLPAGEAGQVARPPGESSA